MSLAMDDIWELFAQKNQQFNVEEKGQDEMWNLAASLLLVKNEQIKDLLYDGKFTKGKKTQPANVALCN